MSNLFKDIYTPALIDKIGTTFNKVHPDFNPERFHSYTFDSNWTERELKERMKHIALALHQEMPDDFNEASRLILNFVAQLRADGETENSIEYMFLPDYYEQFGLEQFDTSMAAFKTLTQFTSCEFTIRPFILQQPKEALEIMFDWTKHSNFKTRRLASEGSRSRLPWGIALTFLKQDPSPVLPILEALKDDETDFVRRSVANNLNDIAKDHPDVVLKTVKPWQGHSKERDWVVKHACRTLLKQGMPEALALFGYGDTSSLAVSALAIQTPEVHIGDDLHFSFRLENNAEEAVKIRLEYAIHFMKANGSLSKKVFKISEKDYAPQSTTDITRKQSFRIITTRKYYPGEHRVSIILNGETFDEASFEVLA